MLLLLLFKDRWTDGMLDVAWFSRFGCSSFLWGWPLEWAKGMYSWNNIHYQKSLRVKYLKRCIVQITVLVLHVKFLYKCFVELRVISKGCPHAFFFFFFFMVKFKSYKNNKWIHNTRGIPQLHIGITSWCQTELPVNNRTKFSNSMPSRFDSKHTINS